MPVLERHGTIQPVYPGALAARHGYKDRNSRSKTGEVPAFDGGALVLVVFNSWEEPP